MTQFSPLNPGPASAVRLITTARRMVADGADINVMAELLRLRFGWPDTAQRAWVVALTTKVTR